MPSRDGMKNEPDFDGTAGEFDKSMLFMPLLLLQTLPLSHRLLVIEVSTLCSLEALRLNKIPVYRQQVVAFARFSTGHTSVA
jgi:hypothetical protein